MTMQQTLHPQLQHVKSPNSLLLSPSKSWHMYCPSVLRLPVSMLFWTVITSRIHWKEWGTNFSSQNTVGI